MIYIAVDTNAVSGEVTTRHLSEEEVNLLQDPLASASLVRQQRNLLVASSDWTQLGDAPISPEKRSEWAAYRQALRDIPQQAGFPADIQWPTKPK